MLSLHFRGKKNSNFSNLSCALEIALIFYPLASALKFSFIVVFLFVPSEEYPQCMGCSTYICFIFPVLGFLEYMLQVKIHVGALSRLILIGCLNSRIARVVDDATRMDNSVG